MGPYKKEFRLLPRKTMHVWAGAPVDLSDLAGRPLDHATLDIATNRIDQAVTELLEGIRGQTAPAERYSPAKARRQERESTGALDEEDQCPE